MTRSKLLWGAVAFCLFLSAVATGDDESDARAIVAKAIKASGGEEKLTKLKAQTWKETGTYYGMGDGLPYVGNHAVQWPKQFKMEIVGVFTIVLDGDKGWMQTGAETRDLTPDEIKIHQDGMYVGWIATLLPLKDKKFKLSTLGEINVKDRPAVGIRVSSEGHRDVNLYFDKLNSLLIKTEHRGIAPEQGNKEVTEETLMSDYKEIDGVQVPHKFFMTRDGEKFVESESNEVQLVGKLDDSLFAKP